MQLLNKDDVYITSKVLMFFGYGVIAFALLKIFANFFFARNNTETPFHISVFIMFLNILFSVSFFNKLGFIIIPIATSISTWIGVFIYLFLLEKNNYLLFQKKLLLRIFKIIIASLIMSIVLIVSLSKFASYLEYENIYKSVYLIAIVGFAGIIYLLSCYLMGILKIKNYKAN